MPCRAKTSVAASRSVRPAKLGYTSGSKPVRLRKAAPYAARATPPVCIRVKSMSHMSSRGLLIGQVLLDVGDLGGHGVGDAGPDVGLEHHADPGSLGGHRVDGALHDRHHLV